MNSNPEGPPPNPAESAASALFTQATWKTGASKIRKWALRRITPPVRQEIHQLAHEAIHYVTPEGEQIRSPGRRFQDNVHDYVSDPEGLRAAAHRIASAIVKQYPQASEWLSNMILFQVVAINSLRYRSDNEIVEYSKPLIKMRELVSETLLRTCTYVSDRQNVELVLKPWKVDSARIMTDQIDSAAIRALDDVLDDAIAAASASRVQRNVLGDVGVNDSSLSGHLQPLHVSKPESRYNQSRGIRGPA